MEIGYKEVVVGIRGEGGGGGGEREGYWGRSKNILLDERMRTIMKPSFFDCNVRYRVKCFLAV